MTYAPDDLIADRYRLVERIAAGGMGEVWRAHDETLDRAVAVKVLLPDSAQDEGFVERFRAEARLSSQLSHPNVGTVHDFGEHDGQAFLVMELMTGAPLSTLIAERAPMPHAEVTEILHQTALALQAAHDAGVVHRDVKPANIVVDPQGVQVGCAGRWAAERLLRADVGRRPEQVSGAGVSGGIGGPGDAEIGEFHQAVLADQDVGRLDVAVDQPGRMCDAER